MGILGFVLVWRSLTRDELAATWLGFLGGALIWIGWFEFSFEYFGKLSGASPVMSPQGYPVLGPNFVLMQASGGIMLALFLFMATNKDSGCRFILWMQRNLGLAAGSSTPGYRRQFARIAALELIFTNWFCYILILILLDPRLFGLHHPVTYAAAAALAALSIYLIGFKLREQRTVGGALRYAIGSVALFWLLCELASLWGWYREVWVKPFDYPLTNIGIFATFVAGILLTQRGRNATEVST
jgi:hypothetical protein